MTQRVAPLGYVLSTKVELGRQCVVCRTMQGHVLDRVCTPLTKWLAVVKELAAESDRVGLLEVARLAAALAALVYIATATAIAFENGSTHLRGDVSPALARRGPSRRPVPS